MSDDLNSILEGLEDEPFTFDVDALPEEGGLRLPPPQPGGPYTMAIPKEALVWKAEAATIDGKPTQRPRLYFTDNPLTVVAAPVGMDGSGQQMSTTITTRESKRGKDKVLVSDAMYLARALSQRPTSLKELVSTLSSKAPNELFDCDIVWEANCNPKRDIYAEGAVQVGSKGCGQQYSMRPRKYKDKNGAQQTVLVIPKAEGKWLDSFSCEGQRLGANGQPEACGAEIRVFPRLRNFRPASPDVAAAVKAAS
jgi:hypothetical protein